MEPRTNTGGSRPHRLRPLIGLLAAAALIISLSACGAKKEEPRGEGDLPKVTIALQGLSAFWANLLVAQENGYFKKAGVEVEVKILGAALAPTEVAAGRLDINVSGATGSFPPALSGRDTEIIYEMIPNAAFKNVIVAGDSPVKSLMELSGKKLGVVGVGTATYGTALAFSNYIVSQGGKPLELVPVNDKAAQMSQVISGVISGAVGKLDDYEAYLAEGKVRTLDIDQATLDRVSPPGVVGSVYWGLKSNLRSKPETMAKFVAGLRMADTWLKKATDAEIGDVLVKSPLIKPEQRESVRKQVPYDKPLYAPTNGYISKEAWDASLAAFKTWKIPNMDIDNPILTYESHVNMSYWDAATKILEDLGEL